VQVPNLIGKSENVARAALDSAGLIAKEPPGSRCSDLVDVGQVAKQGTPTGRLVKRGTSVSFDLANSPCTVDVRSVRSLPVDQAIGLLQAESIAARNIKVQYQTVTDESLDGIVIDQDIEGANVKPFVVTLTVGQLASSGPAATTPSQ
jgi:beta-lactam-binding protein with PASTA domain